MSYEKKPEKQPVRSDTSVAKRKIGGKKGKK